MSLVLEVRGRGKNWKVHYPDEERLSSPVPVYDREGIFKTTVYSGTDKGGMTEAHFVGTQEEAIAYAEYLSPGCEVKIVKTNTQAESLEKARKAKQRQKREEDDE